LYLKQQESKVKDASPNEKITKNLLLDVAPIVVQVKLMRKGKEHQKNK
jgi:hypothetical protein